MNEKITDFENYNSEMIINEAALLYNHGSDVRGLMRRYGKLLSVVGLRVRQMEDFDQRILAWIDRVSPEKITNSDDDMCGFSRDDINAYDLIDFINKNKLQSDPGFKSKGDTHT